MSTTSPRHPVTVSPHHRVTVSPCHLITYVILTTAALYTQYYVIFLPIGLTLYAIWHWRRDLRALAHWLMAQAAVALLYLPWALYAGQKLVTYVGQKVVADADKPLGMLSYFGRHLSAFLVGHLEGPLAAFWIAALALLIPVAVGWWVFITQLKRRQLPSTDPNPQSLSPNPQSPILLTTVFLTALLLGWLISLRAPFFPPRGERLLILALPPVLLLAAAALDALWRRWRVAGLVTLGLVAAASAASLTGFYLVPRYLDDDYRALIAHTIEQGLPEDTVFAVYPWQVGYWRSVGSARGPVAILTPDEAWSPAVAKALDTALARGHVWFPADLAHGAILETQVEAYLKERAVPFVNEWHGPNTRLSAWALTDAQPFDFTREAPVAGLPIRFVWAGSDALTLRSVSGSSKPVAAANTVTPIALAWQADTDPPTLAVSVRLTDDLGQIWAQHDYELVGDSSLPSAAQNDKPGDVVARNDMSAGWSALDHLGLLIPAGTPPGRYRAELVVQPKGNGRAIDALAPDGRVLGPAARLFELDVVPADRPLGPERLPIASHKPTEMEEGLWFLGFSTDDAPLVPGDLRRVSLFWQATAQPAADSIAFVQVLGKDGAPVALWEAPPGAAYPTSQWAPGTQIRTQAGLRVPATVPNGRYRIVAGLFRAADKTRLRTVEGEAQIALGYVTVHGRPHRMAPPQPQHPTDATFGSTARLIGYDLIAAETRPGRSLALTLHWQALSATERPFTVFVHLLDETGEVRGYGDGEPGNGAYPTPGWLAGEYLADEHTIAIAPDAASGTYRLAIGLYDPATGERLKTSDGADQVVIETRVMAR